MSRKVSTPPTMRPFASRRGAALMLTGIFSPSGRTMKIEVSNRGRPVAMHSRRAQAPSHRLEWNTSQHLRPTASLGAMPMISPAARLKEVTVQSVSTVNTPSASDSMMAWQGMFLGKRMAASRSRVTETGEK